MKVHHAVHIMKGSFLHQNLIFDFVSFLTNGLIMMLLPKGSFILAKNVWSSWFLEGTAKTRANERDQGKPSVMNFYFLKQIILFYLSSFVSTVFLLLFQTSSSMVSFIVDSLENLVCSFVERFILPDVLKKANTVLTKSAEYDRSKYTNENLWSRLFHWPCSTSIETRREDKWLSCEHF